MAARFVERDSSKTDFDEIFEYIAKNKAVRDSGGYNSIPFGLAKLDKHVPGIMRGVQYLITANSGVGKTQLAKDLFVNRPYKFVKDHPELGIKLRIIYFAMEESKQEFILSLISNRLKTLYNIEVSVLVLSSMGQYALPDSVLAKIIECKQYFEELNECLDIVDYISNPFGIFKYVRAYARANGKFYFKGQEVNIPVDLEGEGEMYDEYRANDPNEYVICVFDHIGLLQPEKTLDTNTLHGAMSKFSSEYCRKAISKKYHYVPVLVQQQASDKEKVQFTYKGESIESKLEPSLDGLGDCKLTQRDALVIFGLFGPERYGIETHMKYDVTKLQDRYRSLSILKNRLGTPNLKLPLYFEGSTNTFEQLPELGSEGLRRLYGSLS